MTRLYLPICTIAALCALLSGCADDRSQIESKVKFALEACKKATGPVHEVSFDLGKPYPMETFACGEPITNVTITDQILGSADVGPYQFKLRKNTSDGRWHVTQIAWPDLDQARSIMFMDNKAESDIAKVIELLTAVEAKAPKFEEPRITHLKLLLMQRKSHNKQKEPEADRSGLGAAQAWYDKALAEALAADQKNLVVALRLETIAYLDNFRKRAEDFSTPSDSAADWEQAAIKAVRKNAEEAKKKGDKGAYDNAIAEIATREKEAEENIIQREKDAKTMTRIAAALKIRECTEIQAALNVGGVDSKLTSRVNNFKASAGCP